MKILTSNPLILNHTEAKTAVINFSFKMRMMHKYYQAFSKMKFFSPLTSQRAAKILQNKI